MVLLSKHSNAFLHSVAFGMRKALQAEQGKADMERKVGTQSGRETVNSQKQAPPGKNILSTTPTLPHRKTWVYIRLVFENTLHESVCQQPCIVTPVETQNYSANCWCNDCAISKVVQVWEHSEELWQQMPTGHVSTLWHFLFFPNFHSCLYMSKKKVRTSKFYYWFMWNACKLAGVSFHVTPHLKLRVLHNKLVLYCIVLFLDLNRLI